LAQGDGIKLHGSPRVGEQCLYFGGEEKAMSIVEIVQRAHAQPVTGEQQLLGSAVPDSAGELPVKGVKELNALLLVEVDDCLAVRGCSELMTASLQFAAKLDIIEYFAVTDDPN
jgi:hypothetical protein